MKAGLLEDTTSHILYYVLNDSGGGARARDKSYRNDTAKSRRAAPPMVYYKL